MKSVDNKTAKMLELEKQFGLPIEDLMRTLRVDYKKTNQQIADILGVTAPTVNTWFDLIDVTARAKNMPSKSSENGIDIPFYDESSFLQMFVDCKLNDEQVMVAIDLGFANKVWGKVLIPDNHYTFSVKTALKEVYEKNNNVDVANAASQEVVDYVERMVQELSNTPVERLYQTLDHTAEITTRTLSDEAIQRLLTPEERESFVRDVQEDADLRAALAREEHILDDEDDEIQHCIS